jgi:hypothetical protein
MLNPKEKPADEDAVAENFMESPITAAILILQGFPFFLNRLSSASW